MTNPAISVRGLRVVRGGREVLPGVDLDVPAGRVVGLLGPSGSGKSTLIRSVVGVQKVEAGEVTVLGEPAGSPANRRRVGYVTQSPAVYADLTVRANLRYFATLAGLSGAAARDAVERTLRQVDLGSHVDQRVDALSGGQAGRASLAAALVADPQVLVLDEPTVGLDPVLRRSLWELFSRLAAEGRTLLVSSHVMDEATRCDRLLLLREGRVLADAAPADLLERTDARDAEEAFLRLIEDAEGGVGAGPVGGRIAHETEGAAR
ncbi:ABC transporter ATP-binding protein [Kytococcus sp. Marseille-QA3725]